MSARESILRAEGEKQSAILVAEGRKEAAIREAEAEKQSQILRAEAMRESSIREAEGQSEAILMIQKATAEGIRMINEACPTDAVIKIKSLEAFAKAADGKATKIIIPSEIQGLAGLAKVLFSLSANLSKQFSSPCQQYTGIFLLFCRNRVRLRLLARSACALTSKIHIHSVFMKAAFNWGILYSLPYL